MRTEIYRNTGRTRTLSSHGFGGPLLCAVAATFIEFKTFKILFLWIHSIAIGQLGCESSAYNVDREHSRLRSIYFLAFVIRALWNVLCGWSIGGQSYSRPLEKCPFGTSCTHIVNEVDSLPMRL